MPSRKSELSRITRAMKRSRHLRKIETYESRMYRLARDRERKAYKRSLESPEERSLRLARDRERKAATRARQRLQAISSKRKEFHGQWSAGQNSSDNTLQRSKYDSKNVLKNVLNRKKKKATFNVCSELVEDDMLPLSEPSNYVEVKLEIEECDESFSFYNQENGDTEPGYGRNDRIPIKTENEFYESETSHSNDKQINEQIEVKCEFVEISIKTEKEYDETETNCEFVKEKSIKIENEYIETETNCEFVTEKSKKTEMEYDKTETADDSVNNQGNEKYKEFENSLLVPKPPASVKRRASKPLKPTTTSTKRGRPRRKLT